MAERALLFFIFYYPCGFKLTSHHSRNVCTFGKNGFSPCDENDVHPGFNPGNGKQRRSDNTARSVSFYCYTDFFACRYAYTTNTRTVLHYVSHQCRIRVCFSASVGPAEIAVGIQHHIAGQGSSPVPFRQQFAASVCELLSAFSAAASKNLATVSVCHSFTETVFHLALTLLGLVCSFHNYPSILLNNIMTGRAQMSPKPNFYND